MGGVTREPVSAEFPDLQGENSENQRFCAFRPFLDGENACCNRRLPDQFPEHRNSGINPRSRERTAESQGMCTARTHYVFLPPERMTLGASNRFNKSASTRDLEARGC